MRQRFFEGALPVNVEGSAARPEQHFDVGSLMCCAQPFGDAQEREGLPFGTETKEIRLEDVGSEDGSNALAVLADVKCHGPLSAELNSLHAIISAVSRTPRSTATDQLHLKEPYYDDFLEYGA